MLLLLLVPPLLMLLPLLPRLQLLMRLLLLHYGPSMAVTTAPWSNRMSIVGSSGRLDMQGKCTS